jgi:Multicopper oxidase
MPTSPTNVTGGFILIAFQLTNPGTWVIPTFSKLIQLLHCHIAFHISMGLGVQFVERIDEISGNVGVTSDWTTLCEAWESYQSAQHPEQDDSGL